MITYDILHQTLESKRPLEKSAGVATQTLVGAGLGAGLGALAWLIRPKDEDQDRKREFLKALITGAMLGGIGGFGYSRLPSSLGGGKPKPEEKPRDLETSGVRGVDENGFFWSTDGSYPKEPGVKVRWDTVEHIPGAKAQSLRDNLMYHMPKGATPKAVAQNGYDYTVYYTDKFGNEGSFVYHGPKRSVGKMIADNSIFAFS